MASGLGSLRSSVGAFVLAAATMLGANACAKDNRADGSSDDTTSGSSDDGTTTTTDSSDTDSTSSTAGDTSDSASDTFDTSLSFYAGADNDLASVSDCDTFQQDCPEGEKCVPYASNGGMWDDNHCVPVTGNGQAGEPCVSGGILEGTDDCGVDSFCWDVMEDNTGVCTDFCQGTSDAPSCPLDTSCVIANGGSIALCLETCDPLMQACPDGYGCYWANAEYNCLLTMQDNALGQPCDTMGTCSPGLICVSGEAIPDCESVACCGAFCSLSEPECAQPGTECSEFFEEGMAPQQYQDVGVCVVPEP
ncbi:ribulose phosphate epimerase [Enhygromyxa salina]|nr:ribulose phosphate epimerase [Enhygromyxa salina]